jgi:signal peptidase I
MKKAFKHISIVLFAAFFGIACGAVLLLNWSAFGWKALTVPTGSMRPSIPPGSLVLMHRVPNSTLKVGNVITYINPRDPKSTITHRIVKSYKLNNKIPTYITKGDANPSIDPVPVVGGQVVGRTALHVPHLGAWLDWTKHPIGLLAVVYIPAIIILIEEIKRLSDYFRSMQAYKLPGFSHEPKSAHHVMLAGKLSVALIVVAGFVVALPAHALLRSNVVTLANNRLSVGVIQKPPTQTCTNNNNVNVSNNSSQTATSGSATSTNNTNGGTATSGSASNSNSTSTNINVSNNCP